MESYILLWMRQRGDVFSWMFSRRFVVVRKGGRSPPLPTQFEWEQRKRNALTIESTRSEGMAEQLFIGLVQLHVLIKNRFLFVRLVFQEVMRFAVAGRPLLYSRLSSNRFTLAQTEHVQFKGNGFVCS